MRVSALTGVSGVLAAGLLFCGTARSQETSLWQYVHPEAKWLAGVDWQKAKASPTGKMISRQILNAPGAKFTSSGVDALDMIDRVLISSPGQALDSAAEKARMVIVVEGRIDRARLKKMMAEGTGVERFKGVDLLVPPRSKSSEMVMALLSETTGLMGDRTSIEAVLEGAKMGEVPRVDPALLDRAHALASSNEIWAVGMVPPGDMAANATGPMKQLQDLESLDFGVSLQRGLGLKLALGMKTPEAAQGLAAMMQGLTMLAASDPKRNPEMSQMVKNLQIVSDKNSVRLGLQIPLAQLERGVVEAKSSTQIATKRTLEGLLGIGGGAGGMPPGLRPNATLAESTPPSKPAEPVKRTIKIVGLEGGPVELTYTSKENR